MAAKALKMKRMRRAWARPLAHSGGKQPNRMVIQQYKHHAKGLEDAEFVDRVASAILPHNVVLQHRQQLYKQAQLEAGLPDGVDLRVLGPTGRDIYQESWIYFNSQKTCFVLVHRDLNKCIERKSTTYSSKELLLICWEGDRVAWVEKKAILGEENETS